MTTLFARLIVLGCLLACATIAWAEDSPKWQPDEAGRKQHVAGFVVKYCVACHGPDKAEADLRLDNGPANDFFDLSARGKWSEVVNVLNSHEMPPEGELQPKPEETAAAVDWIVDQLATAEKLRRQSTIVVRRLNRDEYRNTIRDLIGVDADVSGFPLDPAAGGFDNNGAALSLSPLHIELYVSAAQQILDRALIDPERDGEGVVQGKKPATVRWRFEVDQGSGDDHRQRIDDQNNPIVQGGNNRVENGMTLMHHNSWDRHLNCRDFRLPSPGDYIVRIRAGGRAPNREAVVASAKAILQARYDQQNKENPNGERWHREAFDNDLRHFQTDRIYDYGRPRLKLIVQLGSQPRPIVEFDVDAPAEKPKDYEFTARFTTEQAGVFVEYAYPIPNVLENFWFQGKDEFARPEALVDWIELEGPIHRDLRGKGEAAVRLIASVDQWPPPTHTAILSEAIPKDAKARRALAETTIERFMRRAYRRPVGKSEVAGKLELYDKAIASKASFVESLKSPLIAILASPHFLFLAEPQLIGKPDDAKFDAEAARRLNPWQKASRLSYLLWSSMPDDELFKLAEEKKLDDPAVLRAQVARMLADPRSTAFSRNFVDQWLGLREVGNNPPAPDLYPQYDRHLETSIVGESRAFFREILDRDLSVMNFVKSDFVTINERLARFYGIEGVRGDDFRRVDVPLGVERGGVVTQASILTITSNGTRTSPVKRGTWVMRNVLGIDPGLPVANAGDIAPKVPGIDKATVRQRLEIHRSLAQCARCHNKIDPLGFALENYNAAGEYRVQEGFGYKGRIEKDDPAIDNASQLLDGTKFAGPTGLRDALLAREDLFLQCLSKKLLTYALGRELGVADQPLVDASVKHLKSDGYKLRGLIEHIVTSEAFATK